MPKGSRNKYGIAASSVVLVAGLAACVVTPPPEPPPDTEIILLPGESEVLIFLDRFDERSNEWQQVRGVWAVEGGYMRQQRSDPREGNSLLVNYEYEISDAEIVTKVSSYGGTSSVSGAGLVFRLKDADNYYMFRLVAGRGAVLGKMVDNEWTDLANPQAADFRVDGQLRPTEELTVRIEGNRIQCWVGEDSVINLVDNQFASGKVGLATFKATAAFDYVKAVATQTLRRPSRTP